MKIKTIILVISLFVMFYITTATNSFTINNCEVVDTGLQVSQSLSAGDNKLPADEIDWSGIPFMSRDLPVMEIETETVSAIIYGYNSEINQTDDSPNITASGQKTRDGIVANNCLVFGTKIKIDNKIYEVQDRMNKKYGCEVFDIWFAKKQSALDWGKQNKIIIIL